MLVLKCPHCGLDTPERTSEEVKTEPLSHQQPPAELSLMEVTPVPLPPAVLDEKTPPKKRGRKAKIQPGAKLEPGSSTALPPLTNGNKKTTPTGGADLQLPKRSKRRIKPTPKILENDELRCEFETKHIERMTHWESAAAAAADGEFETPPTGGGGSNSSTSSKRVTSPMAATSKEVLDIQLAQVP